MLSKREQQVYDLMICGVSVKDAAKRLNLAESSVRTYWSKSRSKMGSANSEKKKPSLADKIKAAVDAAVAKATEPQLKRCSSFAEFKDMMNKISVKSETLEDRVAEFKDVYCKVCIYPTRCKECPTKILMDKYL